MLSAAICAPRLNHRILTVLVCLGALLCFGLELRALAWTGSRLWSEHEGTSACLDFGDCHCRPRPDEQSALSAAASPSPSSSSCRHRHQVVMIMSPPQFRDYHVVIVMPPSQCRDHHVVISPLPPPQPPPTPPSQLQPSSKHKVGPGKLP